MMERRPFLKSAGAAGIIAIGLSTGGCLGDSQQNPQSDEPLQSQGWFSIEGTVNHQRIADSLKITHSNLF